MHLINLSDEERQMLLEMTRKGLGTTAVVDQETRILGIYTDGDLRRSLDSGVDVHRVTVGEVMTTDCKTIPPDSLASEALSMMEKCKINALLVTNHNHVLIGVLNMHDLLRAKVV